MTRSYPLSVDQKRHDLLRVRRAAGGKSDDSRKAKRRHMRPISHCGSGALRSRGQRRRTGRGRRDERTSGRRGPAPPRGREHSPGNSERSLQSSRNVCLPSPLFGCVRTLRGLAVIVLLRPIPGGQPIIAQLSQHRLHSAVVGSFSAASRAASSPQPVSFTDRPAAFSLMLSRAFVP